MNTLFRACVIAALLLVTFSCKKEKTAPAIDKSGSIEVNLTTELAGDKVVYIRTENIYYNNALQKTIVRRDTLPALGEKKQEFTDEKGTWDQNVARHYKFFVTVK